MIRDDNNWDSLLYHTDLPRHGYLQVGENFHVIAIINTSSLLHILLIIGLSARTQAAKCQRDMVLKVKPANSTHLILQDLQSLKVKYQRNCVDQDIKVSNMTATVESYAEKDKTFELDIDAEGNAFIPTDPCFPYKVHVSASVGNESHSLTEKISVTFNYNLRSSDGYPYNNVLKNEVIDKICLVRSDIIRIPEPPASLKSCVFTKGNQLLFREPATNGRPFSVNVEFEITDPHSDFKNPRRICIRTSINQVGSCSKNASFFSATGLMSVKNFRIIRGGMFSFNEVDVV